MPVDLNAIEKRLFAVQAETTQAQAAQALRDFLNNAPTDIESLVAEVRQFVADNTEHTDRLRDLATDLAPFGCRPTMSPTKVIDYARVAILDLTRERDEARAALAVARVDGARGMLDEVRRIVALTDETDADDVSDTFSHIETLDPATVVGSGSPSIHALPQLNAYRWSATGPNGCLLLSPADNVVARIDREGTGWRPQIPGRGAMKWAADFPSAVGQVREVLGDVVPAGSGS